MHDLTECDREPIHMPGAIQPHGMLFGLTRGLCISAVSENAGFYCGEAAAGLIGQKLSRLVDPRSIEQMEAARLAPGQSLRLLGQRFHGSDTLPWSTTVHAQENGLLMEAEPFRPGPVLDLTVHFEQFQNAMRSLQEGRDFAATCRALVAEVRELTGYSRVMLYRFAADWSGEVIAEEADGEMDSFAGLHFPAGDIPVQARALYASNVERRIPDIGYTPVKLLQGGHTPLDLSRVGLRSVSPIHLTYLRNMGVGASMSVSLLRNGVLWGLVACHHPSPLHVPAERMQCCVLLSQIAMARFSLIEVADRARRDLAVKAVEVRMLRQSVEGENGGGGLLQADMMERNGEALLALVNATGLVLCAGGITKALGETPPEPVLAGLLGWLTERGGDVFATEYLAGDFPQALGISSAAGVLAVRLGGESGDFVVWFRREIARSVTWAGNPDKSPGEGANGHLTPRASFAAWREQLRGRSGPWTDIDIATANALRDALVEIVARRALQIHHRNEKLLRSNDELETFAYAAAHDLKEPLRQIEMFGSLLKRAVGRGTDPAASMDRWFAGITSSSRRLRGMIDHLAQYSRLGTEACAFAPADFNVVLAEMTEEFSEQIARCGGTITVINPPLPIVVCDRIQMGQLFQNLISNAIKYRSPDRKLDLRISAEQHLAAVGNAAQALPLIVFRFVDNGIGFQQHHSEQIFRPFERLHNAEKYEGSGLGLAICRKVIERHGGTITATSAPGEGASFTFSLPHRPSPSQEIHTA